MPKQEKKLGIKTRKLPLTIAAAGSGYLHKQGKAGQLPDLPVPFDLNQHASHIGAGVVLGFALRYFGEKVDCIRNRAFMVSVIGTTALGGLFEVTADLVWYRNTTPDAVDAVYVAISSIIGASCIKTVAESDKSFIPETTSLQTD